MEHFVREQIIRAHRGDISFGPDIIRLYAYRKHDGRMWHSAKLEFAEVEKKDRFPIIEPFLDLENHEAQKLMDDLWECGLRPSEGSGSAGAMRKTEEHLADMRTIAFHVLKIQERK